MVSSQFCLCTYVSLRKSFCQLWTVNTWLGGSRSWFYAASLARMSTACLMKHFHPPVHRVCNKHRCITVGLRFPQSVTASALQSPYKWFSVCAGWTQLYKFHLLPACWHRCFFLRVPFQLMTVDCCVSPYEHSYFMYRYCSLLWFSTVNSQLIQNTFFSHLPPVVLINAVTFGFKCWGFVILASEISALTKHGGS